MENVALSLSPLGQSWQQALQSHFTEENVQDIREKVIHPVSQTFYFFNIILHFSDDEVFEKKQS